MKKPWVIYVLVLFILIASYPILVGFEESANITAISSVASFLFGLIAAYTINDRHARSSKVSENTAIHGAELIIIKEASVEFSKEEQRKLLTAIDNYLMATLDYKRADFHRTEGEYKKVFAQVMKLKVKTPKQNILFKTMTNSLEKIEKVRNDIITLFLDEVSRAEWLILTFLIILIYISLIIGHQGTLISVLLSFGLALIATYLMVVAVRFDSLKWQAESKIYEPIEKNFESLGLMRYYPKLLINKGEVKLQKTLTQPYRVGHIKKYPDLKTRDIEIKNKK